MSSACPEPVEGTLSPLKKCGCPILDRASGLGWEPALRAASFLPLKPLPSRQFPANLPYEPWIMLQVPGSQPTRFLVQTVQPLQPAPFHPVRSVASQPGVQIKRRAHAGHQFDVEPPNIPRHEPLLLWSTEPHPEDVRLLPRHHRNECICATGRLPSRLTRPLPGTPKLRSFTASPSDNTKPTSSRTNRSSASASASFFRITSVDRTFARQIGTAPHKSSPASSSPQIMVRRNAGRRFSSSALAISARCCFVPPHTPTLNPVGFITRSSLRRHSPVRCRARFRLLSTGTDARNFDNNAVR